MIPSIDPRTAFRTIRTGWPYLFRLLRENPGRTLRAIANTIVGRKNLGVGGRAVAGSPLEMAGILHSLEPAMAAICRATEGGTVRTIVDAGAHVGVFSVLAAHAFPEARIVALEPNPATAAVCQANLAGLPGAEFRQVALCATLARVRLFAAPGRHDQGATLRPELRRPDQTSEFEAAAVTLSDLIGGLNAIDVLKLDIEGAERGLLAELFRRSDAIGLLFLELHYQEATLTEAEADLARLSAGAPDDGYEILRLDRCTHGRGKYYVSVVGRSRRMILGL